MKKSFEELSKRDIEFLRRRTAIGAANYNVGPKDVENALRYLQTLYEGHVTRRFCTDMLLLYELFGAELCQNVGNEAGQ